ncbi:MAG: glycosyltransferase family 4 protein, partial [Patescibacteria group bacterium]|nr:glycosyltransferase family 4 protein [Patescibacteria group bacterium]
EGLPITLLEAMHARIPVVATEVGGIPEVLEQGRAGLLIELRNPDAIAAAIRRFHCDKELANELKSDAYHRVTTHYASSIMALGYMDIYNPLIDNPRAWQEISLRSRPGLDVVDPIEQGQIPLRHSN